MPLLVILREKPREHREALVGTLFEADREMYLRKWSSLSSRVKNGDKTTRTDSSVVALAL